MMLSVSPQLTEQKAYHASKVGVSSEREGHAPLKPPSALLLCWDEERSTIAKESFHGVFSEPSTLRTFEVFFATERTHGFLPAVDI